MTNNLSENIKNVIEFLSIEGVTGYEKNIALSVKDKSVSYTHMTLPTILLV